MNEWILVVDDDASNLKAASHILVKSGMRASCVRSGEDALHFLAGGRCPDLVLLDIHMPRMDGFETLRRIRNDGRTAGIPVVFLTADEDSESETRGLAAGAMDFIKKPFVPEVLLTRVRHIIELVRLQSGLESQVREKTAEVVAHQEQLERLNEQIVMTLAGAVDAKDRYTNGHSFRVSWYSTALARRLGWEDEELEILEREALLHDLGKIGVPDSVLNKPGRLTDGEYEVIKSHAAVGGAILATADDMVGASEVARHHHERYDGRGYPDGLAGEDIPLHARVVAIADAYDAMRSDRIYRKGLPLDVIHEELVRGRGTQFDPDLLDAYLGLCEDGTLDAIAAKEIPLLLGES